MAIRDTLESYLAAMLVVIDRGIPTDDIVIADIDRVMDLFVDARNALSKAELISLQWARTARHHAPFSAEHKHAKDQESAWYQKAQAEKRARPGRSRAHPRGR